MNEKISKYKLTAYLYGELSGEELKEVEDYLKLHPEEEKQLEQLNAVRNALGKLEDKEVIEPVFIWPDDKASEKFVGFSFYQSSWFKIACSVSILVMAFFTAAYFLKVEFSVNRDGFAFGFQQEEGFNELEKPALTASDVESIIDRKLSALSENSASRFSELSNQIQLISDRKTLDSGEITDVLNRESVQLHNDLRNYASQIQKENEEALKELVFFASKQQQDQFESTLVEFSKYLEQKRNDDLNFILLNLQDLKQHSDNYKSKTNEILASLIEKVNEGNN